MENFTNSASEIALEVANLELTVTTMVVAIVARGHARTMAPIRAPQSRGRRRAALGRPGHVDIDHASLGLSTPTPRALNVRAPRLNRVESSS